MHMNQTVTTKIMKGRVKQGEMEWKVGSRLVGFWRFL